MMKMISRVALAVSVLVATVGTTNLNADTFDGVGTRVVAAGAEGSPTVRVMNNHGRHVSVFVVDSDNRRHLLGTVDHSGIKDLQIPARLLRATGTVQLRVYPVMPQPGLGVSAFEPVGVKTRELSVRSDQVIVLYLEPDLTHSAVGITSS